MHNENPTKVKKEQKKQTQSWGKLLYTNCGFYDVEQVNTNKKIIVGISCAQGV